MLKVLSNIFCDLDPKVKVIGQKAGNCDGVPSTSALVIIVFVIFPYGVLRQVLYLIVSIPDLCLLLTLSNEISNREGRLENS